MAIHKDERREGYVELPHEFIEKLEAHIVQDEKDRLTGMTIKSVHDLIAEHIKDEERLLMVDGMRMEAIERDLRPLLKMYYAIVGSASVGVMLMAIFVWIMVEKNTDIKDVQKSIQAHSIQINETLTILKIKIEQDNNRHRAIDAAATTGNHGHQSGKR